jgi:polyphosphate kinase
LQSPFTLHHGLIKLVEREIENVQKGKPAQIIIKVNAVVEEQAIQALYRASQAGVKIQLIVRGVCSLRPGIPGVSENIEVRSIVGRFLEHTRIYAFMNGGDWAVYAASADLMTRNMFRRVEICFPITDKKISERIMGDLEGYLKDNSQAWLLQTDGQYLQSKPGDWPVYQVQSELLNAYCH